MAITDTNDREARITEMMRVAQMTRQEAEFAVAIELGEVSGDVEVIEDTPAGGRGAPPGR